MKNFIQTGDVITAPAPTGGVTSGDMIAIGKLLGVAATTEVEGADVALAVVGVFDLPVASADDVAVGDVLYWDGTELTLTSTSNDKAGYAVAAAGVGVTTVRIRLAPGVA